MFIRFHTNKILTTVTVVVVTTVVLQFVASQPAEDVTKVGDEDEWRSKNRTGLVLHHKAVVLEPPVDVTLLLHFVEGVAALRFESIKLLNQTTNLILTLNMTKLQN